ncbi:MAG: hypothetical protein QM831_29975 [Kofleriaceae bacterium]
MGPLAGCGGYTGGGDQVLARNTDSITLCENGGYIATVNGAVLEGKQIADGTGTVVATDGATGSTAFVLTYSTDATTATGTDALDGTWTVEDLNQTALDHADVQCQDLVSRSWW